jgi:hypothetical protein
MIERNPGFFTRFILNTIHGPQKYFYFVMGHFGWAWGGTMPRGFWLELVGAQTTLVKKNLIFRPHAITWTV